MFSFLISFIYLEIKPRAKNITNIITITLILSCLLKTLIKNNRLCTYASIQILIIVYYDCDDENEVSPSISYLLFERRK